jgi:hypothetical protein
MTTDRSAVSPAPGLSRAQWTTFEATGVVRLPGLIPRVDALAMADRIWDFLARRDGVRRDAPETWTSTRPAQFAPLSRAGAFGAMASPGVHTVLDEVFGADGWVRPKRWGLPLVTFPAPGRAWDVPHASWHLDLDGAVAPSLPTSYLRLFVLLADLEPRGGGAAYVSGSHRLSIDWARRRGGKPIRSAEARERLVREHPWFAALCSAGERDERVRRFMDAGATIDGVEVRVREMLGEAGDVILMHPATLHTAAPNGREVPRMMLVEGIAAVA